MCKCQAIASTSFSVEEMNVTEPPKFKPKKPRPHFSTRTKSGFTLGGRVWLEKDGKLYMGLGRMRLLEKIDELGSIAAAARSMKLGYRNAWLWVDSMNQLAPTPLVEKVSGGVGGRHAILTEEGRKAINEYKQLRARFLEFLGQTI